MAQQLGNPEIFAQLANLSNKIKYAQNESSLQFIACNNTKTVVNFHQSFFWYKGLYKHKIKASSATASLDQNAPMLIFLQNLIAEQLELQEEPELTLLDINDFTEDIAEEWHEWLPEHVLWCPLTSPTKDKELLGGLIFTREYPWTNADANILGLIASFTSLSLSVFLQKTKSKPSFFSRLKRKTLLSFSLATLIGILLIPVSQTVLAPAEIVAEDPFVITSPINEVVDKFYVKPNQKLTEGNKLFSLDQTELKNNLIISTRDYQVAIEKLRRSSQFSFENTDGNAKLSILKLEAEKAKLKMQYNQDLLEKSMVFAPVAGEAIFSDKDDWIGKPVKIGEKVMEIANPNKKKLKLLLPVTDAITLEQGNKIKLYLNVNPLNVIEATLSFASYSATMQPDGIYAYTLKGEFNTLENVPRIGLRGTAKVYGEKNSLFFFLLRKPFATLRQKLGI